MNEVARYVRDGINKYGEDSFRKELIILGKTEADIKVWFEFTNFSLKNEERLLNLNTVFESHQKLITLYQLIRFSCPKN